MRRYIYISILMICVFLCGTSYVGAATMSITVAQQTVSKGDTILVDWHIDTQGSPINVVDATVYVSTDTLTIQDISTGSSSLILWIVPPTIVSPGVVHFVGGIPGGAQGKQIPVLRTTLKAVNAGNATIALGKDSRVALGDGTAMNVPLTMNPIAFPVIAASDTKTVTSATHPNQDLWYKTSTVKFTINEKNPISYSFSSNPEIIPSAVPAVVTAPITYESLPDGVYYFKVAIPIDGILQEVQTYRVLIDATSPVIASAVIDTKSEVFDGHASLNVYAIDKTAGLASIKAKTGWFGWYREVNGAYKLHRPLFGNVVNIKVVDVAGNTTKEKIYFWGYLPNWISYCVILFVLVWICISVYKKRTRVYFVTKKILRFIVSR